jgi:hypothetical protein
MWNVGKSIVNPTTTEIINATRQVRWAALPSQLQWSASFWLCYVLDALHLSSLVLTQASEFGGAH